MKPASSILPGDAARARLAKAGVQLEEAAWVSLPEAARKRLLTHPVDTDSDRRALRTLASWLAATFPPGWNAAAE